MAWVKIDNVKGPQGETGPAGVVSGVSVASVDPEVPAKATMTQVGDLAHLHLDIPRGEDGKQGPPGVASSASAEPVPYGVAPEVILSQEGELVHAKFRIPGGAPGTNSVPAAEAVGAYLAAEESPSRPGLEQGMAQVAADPDSAFAVDQKAKLDTGLAGKANLVGGKVPAVELPTSSVADPNTIPMRGAGGRLSGIGDPTDDSDASTKQYVDAGVAAATQDATANLQAAMETTVTLDELVFSARFDCGYTGTTPIVEFTTTTVHTVFVAPFPMEVVSVALAFERYSLPANNTNYVRAWAQKLRDGEPAQFTLTKTTQSSGGESITPRKEWNLTDGGITAPNNQMVKGDLLTVNIGVTGSPAPVQYPFVVTVKYRPL